MTVTAILPVPARFAARPDAVLAPLAGRSALVRCVQTLARGGDVVVAVAAPLADAVGEILAGPDVRSARMVVADEPGERADCVAAALRDLDGARSVLLHDIEWPVVAAHTVAAVADALRGGAIAVMPVVAVTDSVKSVDARGVLTGTLDRSTLRTVQYPRGFAADNLAALLAARYSGDGDELEAVLSAGPPLTVVDGDADAVHVELPRDAAYLSALLQGRGR
ncbi:2-C-methyl-D-erythritol 4-phosphate cytidylyltransferase [Mycobacterium sp. Y57]|uniref:2-C-methyl-D-erythritol 4-phosphate cytidylyltransferase n=1 Tax=Mycolicibacterium xanthum TaxID=2796469 RepID=UPI001C844E7A|nr:2-C-methyl-D-erythritol 4-phosphate cytidylyltransferase [Mycolicibacterium xanthum]MBX7434997.1 2-C-methyl-D-erythritol 4-phosphate cytidylyltransferase [Mycolicibacterium xanthum]